MWGGDCGLGDYDNMSFSQDKLFGNELMVIQSVIMNNNHYTRLNNAGRSLKSDRVQYHS